MANQSQAEQSRKMMIAATIPDTVRLLMRGQIDWLARNGYQIDVCTSSDGLSGLESAQIVDSISHHYKITMAREISLFSDLRALLQWIKLLRKTKPEFLIANTPKASLLSLIAGAICRVPHRVYILRGLRYETSSGLSRTILRLCEVICMRSAHIVVAVSPSLAALAKTEKLASDKLRVIGKGSSNGVNAQRFQPLSVEQRKSIRESMGYSDDDFIVGFVGRLTPDKGIETLISAMQRVVAQHPHVRLLAVGPNEGSEIDEPWATNLGPQEHPETIYPLFDAFALPTRREGFPNAALEAAACEIPVITSNATGAIDSVEDGVTGLIAYVDDAESFAHAINELVSNRERATLMGQNGRARVLADFTPESIWRGLDEIYRSM